MTATAVVTIAHGRRHHLAAQRQLLAGQGVHHVVVAMADPGLAADQGVGRHGTVVRIGGDPARLPLAAARNAGARAALAAGARVLIFLDVDCLPAPGLVRHYSAAAIAHPQLLLSGPVGYLPPAPPGGYPLGDPQALAAMAVPAPGRPVPTEGRIVLAPDPDAFWSLSFALSADLWSRLPGFHEGYEGYGAEDTDFSATAGAAGVGMAWVGGATAYHQDHGRSGPVAEHVADIVRNAGLFHARWGRWPMPGWFDRLEREGLIERSVDGVPRVVHRVV